MSNMTDALQSPYHSVVTDEEPKYKRLWSSRAHGVTLTLAQSLLLLSLMLQTIEHRETVNCQGWPAREEHFLILG